VAHGSKKPGFRSIGGFGLVARSAQIDLMTPLLCDVATDTLHFCRAAGPIGEGRLLECEPPDSFLGFKFQKKALLLVAALEGTRHAAAQDTRQEWLSEHSRWSDREPPAECRINERHTTSRIAAKQNIRLRIEQIAQTFFALAQAPVGVVQFLETAVTHGDSGADRTLPPEAFQHGQG
jgi:hypothetical protein